MKFKFRVVVGSGERVPYGYGVSIMQYERQQVICYPIGINVVVALCHRVYCYLAYKIYSRYVPLDEHTKIVSDAFVEGMEKKDNNNGINKGEIELLLKAAMRHCKENNLAYAEHCINAALVKLSDI
jgi:hypothetical protein